MANPPLIPTEEGEQPEENEAYTVLAAPSESDVERLLRSHSRQLSVETHWRVDEPNTDVPSPEVSPSPSQIDSAFAEAASSARTMPQVTPPSSRRADDGASSDPSEPPPELTSEPALPPDAIEECFSALNAKRTSAPASRRSSTGSSSPLPAASSIELMLDSALQATDSAAAATHVLANLKPHSGGLLDSETGSLLAQLLVSRIGHCALLEETDEDILTGRSTAGIDSPVNTSAVCLSLQLLHRLPVEHPWGTHLSPQVRVASRIWQAVLSSTMNREILTCSGVNALLVETFTSNSTTESLCHNDTVTALEEALAALLAHSSTSDLLHRLLTSAMHTGSQASAIRCIKSSLEQPEARGPQQSIRLNGFGSGLLARAHNRWPFNAGLTFAAWLFIESFVESESSADSCSNTHNTARPTMNDDGSNASSPGPTTSTSRDEYMPRLFSFITNDGSAGIEAMFHGSYLVIDVMSPKSRRETVRFNRAIAARQWTLLAVELATNAVRLYVDGEYVEEQHFGLPTVSKALGFTCIGSNPTPAVMSDSQRRRKQCALAAELSCCIIFDSPVGGKILERLHSIAHSDLASELIGVSFGRARSGFGAQFDHDHALFKAIEQHALHVFHASSCASSDSYVPDLSPRSNKSKVVANARSLQSLHVTKRNNIHAALWSSGTYGPAVLLASTLPSIDGSSLQPVALGSSIARREHAQSLAHSLDATSLLCKYQHSTVERLSRSGFVIILSHLLLCGQWKTSSRGKSRHRRHDVADSSASRFMASDFANVEAERSLVRALFTLQETFSASTSLHWELWDSVILEPRVWRGTTVTALSELAEAMKNCAAQSNLQNLLCHNGALQRALDLSRSFSSITETGKADLSDSLMLFTNLVARPENPPDMHAILKHIAVLKDGTVAAAVLRVIRGFLQHPNSKQRMAATRSFLDGNGIVVALTLLRRFAFTEAEDTITGDESNAIDEGVRLLALCCIRYNMMAEADKKLALYMMQSAIYYHGVALSPLGTHTALLQAALSNAPNGLDSDIVDGAASIMNMGVLGVFLNSLPSAPAETQMQGLQDVLLLACTEAHNRAMLESSAGWPEAISRILVYSKKCALHRPDASQACEAENVGSMAKNLFTVMLQHAIRSNDGWRKWEQILQVMLDVGIREHQLMVSEASALELFIDLIRFTCEEFRSAAQSLSLLENVQTSEKDDPSETAIMHNNAMCLLVELEGFLRTIADQAKESGQGQTTTGHQSVPEVKVDTWLTARTPSSLSELVNSNGRDEPRSVDSAVYQLGRKALHAACEVVKILVTCVSVEGPQSIRSDEHLLLIRILLTALREEAHYQQWETRIDEEAFRIFSHSSCSGAEDAAAQPSGTEALLRKALAPLLSKNCGQNFVDRALASAYLLYAEIATLEPALYSFIGHGLSSLLVSILHHWAPHLRAVFNISTDGGNMLDTLGDIEAGESYAEHTFCDERWKRCFAEEWVNEHIEMTVTDLAFVDRNGEHSQGRHSAILEDEGKYLAEAIEFEAWWSTESEWQNSKHGQVEKTMQNSETERTSAALQASESWARECSRFWRSYMKRLVEQNTLLDHFTHPIHTVWRVDDTEDSSRERRRLVLEFDTPSHEGAAIDDHGMGRDATRTTEEEGNKMPGNDEIPDVKPPVGDVIQSEEDDREHDPIEEDEGDLEEQLDSLDDLNYEEEGSHRSRTASRSWFTGPNQEDSIRQLFETECELIRPLDKISGILRITSKDTSFTPHEDGKAGHAMALGHESIDQLHCRRYLLRRTALEIFLTSRRSLLFNFNNKTERRRALKSITTARPSHLGNSVYLDGRRINKLGKAASLTERWVKREICNFDYLMHLNTLAGRSFNDLTQYPVFPWVVQDYTSDILDLQHPGTFRDLSKPIGALNPERLQKFIDRYNAFDDPVVPKFMYGSHYSSAGTVLHYLLRLEPFTSHAIELQGGNFDHPDRLFRSVKGTWNSVLNDMSDVKVRW